MRKFASAALCASLMALAIAGCATREAASVRPPVSRPPEPPRARRQLPPPVLPADYVVKAGQYHLFIERASRIALRRAQRRRIRDIAAKLVQEHSGLATQLSLAGRRLNVLPRATLDSQFLVYLDQLSRTPSFDQWYLQHMLARHGEVLALHAAFARGGSSPTLRPVAAAAAAIERRHIMELEQWR